MHIEKSTVNKLTISQNGLDTLHVYIEDYELGKGQITITCYGEAWSNYWGAMSDRTMSQFFSQASTEYLATKMTRVQRRINDYDGIKTVLFKEICERRKNSEFTEEDARELWNEVDCSEFDERLIEEDLIRDILGDDWYEYLPTKTNPDYEYLCKIIEVVKIALKQS